MTDSGGFFYLFIFFLRDPTPSVMYNVMVIIFTHVPGP